MALTDKQHLRRLTDLRDKLQEEIDSVEKDIAYSHLMIAGVDAGSFAVRRATRGDENKNLGIAIENIRKGDIVALQTLELPFNK